MGAAGLNLIVGWASLVAGVAAGAWIGLSIDREDWLGGYASRPRRMVRLGHVAFFGLGFVNILYALTVKAAPIPPGWADAASIGFAVAVLTMSPCCFLTAWRRACRHLFPVPVLSALTGMVCLLGGWMAR